MRKSRIVVAVALVIVGVAAYDHVKTGHEAATLVSPVTRATSDAAAGAAAARAQLASLKVVADADPVAGYSREKFGDGWATQADGCDTRADLLAHTSAAPVTRHGRCTVRTGRWVVSYNGQTYTQASKTQIDHIVPLHYAWDVAASGWTASQRESFANDTSELVVSDVHDNEVKQDDMPPDWEPIAADRCAYAEQMIAELAEWSIPVTARAKPALTDMLAGC